MTAIAVESGHGVSMSDLVAMSADEVLTVEAYLRWRAKEISKPEPKSGVLESWSADG